MGRGGMSRDEADAATRDSSIDGAMARWRDGDE
jgi:hypothetical protein